MGDVQQIFGSREYRGYLYELIGTVEDKEGRAASRKRCERDRLYRINIYCSPSSFLVNNITYMKSNCLQSNCATRAKKRTRKNQVYFEI